ncbi:glycosyltransferase family 2 protein [Aureitalea marina]|uniref:Glycosyltransferase 2-like domain-containing protein n=1 Tax=Aureitalea marina TaxID=930804 RepID=A0A2S7KQE9_9FLAO|nr:glycosyltransferase [Aureitalea marina]PQB04841.1 hypothetical protein BST85_07995 [Aureitalea marina]
MLSVLIPTHNDDVQPLLMELDQQRSELDTAVEIIVWDDASDQLTSESLQILTSPGFKQFRSEKNQGRSTTRNLLTGKAKYDWLLFLDADTLPVNPDFLQQYVKSIQTEPRLVHGGISYSEQVPDKEYRLRWAYGRRREMQTLERRNVNPHLVMTGNLMIQKQLFLDLNKDIGNFYGDDLLISDRIRKKGIEVLHIENPVWHLGLEPSDLYLSKLLESDRVRYALESDGTLSPDLTRIQQFHHRYKWLMPFYRVCYAPWKEGARRNLIGENPSIRTLDLYRLYHYGKNI